MTQFNYKSRRHHLLLIAISWAIGLLLAMVVAVADAADGRWELCEVTAYAGHCPICETTGVTANGTHVDSRPYGAASSPNIGLGSRIFIPIGYGYLDESSPYARWYIADDRGGAVTTEWRSSGVTRIDLRYKTHASAKQFGRKLMMVFIVSPL